MASWTYRGVTFAPTHPPTHSVGSRTVAHLSAEGRIRGWRPTALDGECLTTTRGEACLTPRLRCRTVSENYAAPIPVSRETAATGRPVVSLLFSRSAGAKHDPNTGSRQPKRAYSRRPAAASVVTERERSRGQPGELPA